MLASCVGFAVMATAVSAAHARVPGMSTLVSSVMRAGVNLVALAALARFDRRRLLGDGRWELWSRGLFGGASLLCYFTALSRLGIGEAAFLNQTSSVWVAAMAPFVLRERTSALVWLAVLGSVVGVGFLGHPREGAGDLEGRVAALASGLFAASAYVSIRRASATNEPITIVFYFTLVGTLAAGGLALAERISWPTDPWVYALLSVSGLAATGAQLLMTRAYGLGRAGPVAAAGAVGPLLTTIMGWALLDQVPDQNAYIGMAILVVTGVGLPFLAGRQP